MIAILRRRAMRLVEAAAVLLLLAMLASVFLGVAFRLIGRPLTWTDEMAQYLLVWTAFAGWIVAGERGSHIRITAIAARLRGRARVAAAVAAELLTGALGVLLLTRSFGLIARNADVEWVSLPLPVALVYAPVPVAGLAVTLHSLAGALAALRGAERAA
jgi:TRAP-type C4-dicarboxylate transport system permease small subunit